MQHRLIIFGWFAANVIAVALLAFADLLVLRIIGWIWISLAISVSGLVEVGGLISHWLETKKRS